MACEGPAQAGGSAPRPARPALCVSPALCSWALSSRESHRLSEDKYSNTFNTQQRDMHVQAVLAGSWVLSLPQEKRPSARPCEDGAPGAPSAPAFVTPTFQHTQV